MDFLLAALLVAAASLASSDPQPLSTADLARARSACDDLLAGGEPGPAGDLPLLVLRRAAGDAAFEPDETLRRGIAESGVLPDPWLICVRETAVRCGDPAQAPPALEWRVVRRLGGEVAAVRMVGQPADVQGEYLELPLQLHAWLRRAGEHHGLPIMAQVVGEVPPPPGAVRCAEQRAPEVVEQAPPQYPAEARAKRVQGVVVVEARIDAEGRVEDVQVVRGEPLLAEAAREAIRKWRFRPALCDGRPVTTIYTLSTTFSLKD